jgi:hypothetical protein
MKGRSVPALSALSYAYGRGLGAESVEELLGFWTCYVFGSQWRVIGILSGTYARRAKGD